MASSPTFAPVEDAVALPASIAPSERIHALDALRGVAMFLGIALHAGMVYTVTPVPGGSADVSRSYGFDVMILLIHGFRMQLFFFLAGFFGRLLHERLGTNGFLKQRGKRVGLPFLLGMISIMPVTVFLALWGYARNGQPMPENPGGVGGIPTVHLWFLLYLGYLYIAAVLIVRIPKTQIGTRALDFIFSSRLRILPFALLSAIFLWNGPWWGEPVLGIFGLMPVPMTLAYYGTFFAGGWWLHARKEHLPKLREFIWPTLIIGFIAEGVATSVAYLHFRPIADEMVLKCIVLFCAATYAWAMTFAGIGIVLRFFAKASVWGRYLADASYWCYLAHMPVVIFLQIFSANLPWPALIKFILILAVTMALLLVLYEYRVRYHWLGNLLNGPRVRSKFNCGASTNQEISPAN